MQVKPRQGEDDEEGKEEQTEVEIREEEKMKARRSKNLGVVTWRREKRDRVKMLGLFGLSMREREGGGG